MNKPPPINRNCNKDPNFKALKRKGFINHESTLWGLGSSFVTERVPKEPTSGLILRGDGINSNQ